MHPTKAIRHTPNVVLRFAPRVSCPALPFFMGLFVGVFAPFGTATPANIAPSLSLPPSTYAYEGEAVTLSASADDPDAGQTVTVTASGYPAGLTYVVGSAVMPGTSTATLSGTLGFRDGDANASHYIIAWVARDDLGSASSDTTGLTVRNTTLTSINVSPFTAALHPGETQQFEAFGNYSNESGRVLGPETGVWTNKRQMETAHVYTMGAVLNGQLYVIGGSGTTTMEAYDPVGDAWISKTSTPTSRALAGAAALDGKLYVMGGCIGSDCTSGGTDLLEIYDSATNEWTTGPHMITARSAPSVGVIDGRIYVAGGGFFTSPHLASAEVYDPAESTWTMVEGAPHVHGEGAAGVINGKLYVFGGEADASVTPAITPTLDVYDPVGNAWTTKASMQARYGMGGAVIDGVLYAVGGTGGNPYPVTSTVQAYDPASDTWTTKASMPTARTGLAVGVINGVLYAAGGASTDTLGAFTPGDVTWSSSDTTVATIDANGLATARPRAASSTISASSGAVTDRALLTVTPIITDHPPTVSAPPGINGAEGGTLAFDVSASDPDEDAITSLTANLSALPEGNGATFTPHEGNTSGSFLWHTTSGDAGTYQVSFRATSNDLSGTDTTTITVVPASAEVTGLLTWTPRPGDEGVYNVIFSATDVGGTSTLTTAITVVPGSPSPAPSPPLSTPSLRRPGPALSPDATQRGPIVSGPAGAAVAPGTTLTVPVSASSAPEGTSPLAAALRPTSARMTVRVAQVISLSADLRNLPPINDATFVVDHAPVVGGPSSVTANAGVPVTFARSASDPDGDPIDAFTADLSGLPAGDASFSANAGNTVGTFSWTPKLTDAGAFVVSFTASNQLVGSASTTITVRSVSAARIFLPGQQKINLGSGHRDVCVQIEPVGRSFELADVNLATVRMISFGTGTVSEIPAITGRGLEIGDRDRNRIPDMAVCFTMADLRRLFSLLGGNDNNGDFHQSMGRRRIRNPVTATIQGQLTSGAFFAGTWTVEVKSSGESENDVRISPNPLNPQGELAFTLVKSGFLRVTLFDMRGRLVRTLLEEANAIAGEHAVTFDGRDATGTKLASGIYFFRIESPDGSKRGRLAIVR